MFHRLHMNWSLCAASVVIAANLSFGTWALIAGVGLGWLRSRQLDLNFALLLPCAYIQRVDPVLNGALFRGNLIGESRPAGDRRRDLWNYKDCIGLRVENWCARNTNGLYVELLERGGANISGYPIHRKGRAKEFVNERPTNTRVLTAKSSKQWSTAPDGMPHSPRQNPCRSLH